MEEYKQVYELARHHDNIASNKEAIFAVAAFGILAFALNADSGPFRSVIPIYSGH